MSAAPRFALGIRAKVLLASSTLLLVPWLGFAFVAEMERLLADGQARMLADSARAAAAVIQKRADGIADAAGGKRELAPALAQPIELDGAIGRDWIAQRADVRAYGGERIAELYGPWTAQSLSFSHAVGRYGDHVYAFFDVTDDRVVYCGPAEPRACDHVRVSLKRGEDVRRYTVTARAPGPLTVLADGAASPGAALPDAIEGVWVERAGGYTVELRLPAAGLRALAFAVADVDDASTGAFTAIIVTEERQEATRAGFEVGPDAAAALEGMARANLRIWLADRTGAVVARVGSLQAALPPEAPAGGFWGMVERARSVFAAPRAPAFVDPLAQASRLTGAEVESALAGKPALRVHESPAGGTLISAAAHPIEIGGTTVGAALVEQTTESITQLRQLALERLLVATLAAFVFGALLLILYASRLSRRLRQLRDEAERAIDSTGRVRGLVAESTTGDEIGDLSRSYSAVLTRLAQYTEYLENLARRLNHELRTPLAVVRSSLDNLRSERLPPGAPVYLDRAEAGLARLSAILSRMSEATRLEEIMRRPDREKFDLDAVVGGCAEGYRLAYAPREIRYNGPGRPVRLTGVPDLIAQMLDKLVENAAEHATPGTPIDIELDEQHIEIVLRVRNEGAPLPEAMQDRLFESMVSVQPGLAGGVPHLGLGLYIVKLIARFHHGAASAANRDDKPGVEVTVRLARYVSDPA